MNKFYLFFLFLTTSFNVFSTAQSSDLIVVEKDTLSLFTNPLEQYFENKNERTINKEELTWKSTDCYRGYQATWTIKENCLFLLEIRKGCHTHEKYNLFDEFKDNEIIADWYSGQLNIPSGNQIHYEHSGYLSLYEFETILTIENGELQSIKEYDNSNFYKSVFTENQDMLITHIIENIDWNKIDSIDKTETIIARIKSGSDKYSFTVYLIKESENQVLNKEVIKVLNDIPEWSVYYKKGKPYTIQWTVPIRLGEKMKY